MTTLFIFNDSPHHVEKSFHGLRLAAALAGQGETVKLLLFADGVLLTAANPDARFEIGSLLERLIANGAHIRACKSCLAERGIDPGQLPDNAAPATLNDAAAWTTEASKVLVY